MSNSLICKRKDKLFKSYIKKICFSGDTPDYVKARIPSTQIFETLL